MSQQTCLGLMAFGIVASVVCLAAGLVLAFIVFSGKPSPQAAKPPAKSAPPSPKAPLPSLATPVDANKLCDEYSATVVADAKYKGRRLQVKGRLSGIQHGVICLVFGGSCFQPDGGLYCAHCEVPDTDLVNLSNGDQLILEGVCNGYNNRFTLNHFIRMVNCRVVGVSRPTKTATSGNTLIVPDDAYDWEPILDGAIQHYRSQTNLIKRRP